MTDNNANNSPSTGDDIFKDIEEKLSVVESYFKNIKEYWISYVITFGVGFIIGWLI